MATRSSLDAKTGAICWTRPNAGIANRLAIENGRVFMASFSGMHVVDATTGKLLMRTDG
jgi:outer membrane protein assembly factor BamB